MSHPLTSQARDAIRTVPWRTVLASAGGVSIVTLLTIAGFAPILPALASGALTLPEVQTWLSNLGANALSGWVAQWGADRARAGFVAAGALREPAADLEQRAAADPDIAPAIAKLLAAIEAVPQSLEALQAEVGAQSEVLLAQHELLKRLGDDVARVGLGAAELRAFVETVTRGQAERILERLDARADRIDAQLAQVLTALQAMASTQAGVTIGAGAQMGDLTTGDIAGRDLHKTIIQVFDPILRRTPPPYAASVRSMIAYYQEVFGGRETELAALDAWLDDPAHPYAFLYAPTGRGKTALLIHWVARVERRGEWHIIFVPISIRYQTASAERVFGALATALAAFHQDNEFSSYNTSPDQLRPTIADYLSRPAADGRRLLVVLDGLDEATGWEVGPDLFPRTPPPHLRVVIAAREYAHTSRLDWYTRLNWRSALIAEPPLTGLNKAAVSDVLRQMGNPLDQHATDVDVLAELARVSNGDPLTIRFLVEALHDGDLLPERLHELPDGWKSDGLKAYIKQWLKELRQQSVQAPAVSMLLRLCAGALGPLTFGNPPQAAALECEQLGGFLRGFRQDLVFVVVL